nr:hypothetical protein [Tanacetum cinerariifolium]
MNNIYETIKEKKKLEKIVDRCPSRRRFVINLQPPPTEKRAVQGVGFTDWRFEVSISQIIPCEGVDWEAMTVSQSKQNTNDDGRRRFLHFNDSHKLALSSSFSTIEVDEATTEINKGYNYTTSLGEVDEATTEIKKGYNYTTSLGATQKIINILQVKSLGLYAFKTNNTVSQRSNYKLQRLSQNMDKKGAKLSVLRSRRALNICTGT